MTHPLSGIFSRGHGPPPTQAEDSGATVSGRTAVHYRPRLVAELMLHHATARRLVRSLLDACRHGDETLQIARLRDFADCFHRLRLIKNVQLYPYLRWALQDDAATLLPFQAVQTEVQQCALRVEAVLTEYLSAPWDAMCRRRFVPDVARAVSLFGQILRQDETTLFPLYLPPDQYRYVTDASAA